MTKNEIKRNIHDRFLELTKGETDDQIMTKTGLTERDLDRIEDSVTKCHRKAPCFSYVDVRRRLLISL